MKPRIYLVVERSDGRKSTAEIEGDPITGPMIEAAEDLLHTLTTGERPVMQNLYDVCAKAFECMGAQTQTMCPPVVNVSFDVTQEVAAALRALRGTGFFGNGVDCASVAEELLHKALRDPSVLPYWRKP